MGSSVTGRRGTTLPATAAIAMLALASSLVLRAAPPDAPTSATTVAPAAKTIPGGGPKIRARRESSSTIAAAHGRSYRIHLSVPEGEPPAGGFPVLYVLDGDAWFGAAVAVVRMREYSKLAPTVVVGVGSPSGAFFDLSRNYDFTPAAAADQGTDDFPAGGADEFREFLGGKLSAWIRKQVRVDESREFLFGHSLGAMFAVDTLLAAPDTFDAYIAASPSIRLFDRIIVKSAEKCTPRTGSRARVLVTVGGLESRPSPALVEDYRRFFTAHPDAVGGQPVEAALAELFPDDPGFDKTAETRALAARLGECGFAATFAEFADEEHTSAAISALNRGVPFALRGR
jgi:predicted alpha/beta superfamily hydrolase